MQRIKPYIYQKNNWPEFTWDNEALLSDLLKVRNWQGRLMGKLEAYGFSLREEANLGTLTLDVLKSSEIEGEVLQPEQVRSSIARRLGLEIAGLVPSDRNVDGVVEMMVDATLNYLRPLTKERLFGWHSSLFPGGRSGMHKIVVGQWRDDATGPMEVVSGALGKEKIHFQAPPAEVLEEEMARFILWFNAEHSFDTVLKAGIAHLWFVTLHPFDDGNGRIARALADMLLARADESSQRFYSMSSQIRAERKQYYELLEKTQKGSLDITTWLHWFLLCLQEALKATDTTLSGVLAKAHFWEKHANTFFSARQKSVVLKLMDGFEGNLSTSKWAKLTKCSEDTALRDIQDLLEKNVLRKTEGGGRSTRYVLVVD